MAADQSDLTDVPAEEEGNKRNESTSRGINKLADPVVHDVDSKKAPKDSSSSTQADIIRQTMMRKVILMVVKKQQKGKEKGKRK